MEVAFKTALLQEVEMQVSVAMAFCSLEKNATTVTYRIGTVVLEIVKLRQVTPARMTIL